MEGKTAVAPVAPIFAYEKGCLERALDDTKAVVTAVKFEISRYGAHLNTIAFEEKVTEKQAISAAEQFLSEILTPQYLDLIRDDIRIGDDGSEYRFRGDCLGDAKWLEKCQFDIETGTLTLLCGS